jgi:hypothetical protein
VQPLAIVFPASGSSVSPSRVSVSLNWRGATGEQLLDSKLKFVNGKSMVIGADKEENSSTILCVRLDCR